MGKISLADFINKAKEEGCEVVKNQSGIFIGNPPATNYPHIHIWNDKSDSIALSAGHRQNGKVGKDDEIDINELFFQEKRYGENLSGGLKETISWVIRSDN